MREQTNNSFVESVQPSNAELETRMCSVTYDDAIDSVSNILGETADNGYKLSLIETGGL
jgi:hypothetical protein